jgi:hypothetical protein
MSGRFIKPISTGGRQRHFNRPAQVDARIEAVSPLQNQVQGARVGRGLVKITSKARELFSALPDCGRLGIQLPALVSTLCLDIKRIMPTAVTVQEAA